MGRPRIVGVGAIVVETRKRRLKNPRPVDEAKLVDVSILERIVANRLDRTMTRRLMVWDIVPDVAWMVRV